MASNGLMSTAKKGTCRICYRVRFTYTQVKAVGEIRHGYATGHIWECNDVEDCDKTALERINTGHSKSKLIEIALEQGRFKDYVALS